MVDAYLDRKQALEKLVFSANGLENQEFTFREKSPFEFSHFCDEKDDWGFGVIEDDRDWEITAEPGPVTLDNDGVFTVGGEKIAELPPDELELPSVCVVRMLAQARPALLKSFRPAGALCDTGNAKIRQAATEFLGAVENLTNEYGHWQRIYENGANDPMYEDGANLYLVRNHILYDKEEVAKLLLEHRFEVPPVLFSPMPPVVSQTYMANAELLRENAVKTLGEIRRMKEYRDLLPVRMTSSTPIGRYMYEVERLEMAISDDNFLEMRNLVRRLKEQDLPELAKSMTGKIRVKREIKQTNLLG